MDATTLNYLSHKVANALMRHHGFDRRNEKHKWEFDHTHPESQYSMMFSDADVAVRTAIESLMDLGTEDEVPETPQVATTAPDETVDTGEPDVEYVSTEDVFTEPKPASKVAIINNMFIICQKIDRDDSITIKDIKIWLEQMENAGAEDDHQVEGFLHGEVQNIEKSLPPVN